MSDRNDNAVILAVADRVNEIRNDVIEIKVTMATNTASLQEHMRRTALLENQVEPLRAHVTMVNGVLKFIGFLAVLAGIAEGVVQVINK
jgi:archaellum component FlaC